MEPVVLTDEETRLYHRLRLKLVEDEYDTVVKQGEALAKGPKDPLSEDFKKLNKKSKEKLEKDHARMKSVLDSLPPVKPGQPEPTKPTKP